jgi:tRNA dimethylallyltransferase
VDPALRAELDALPDPHAELARVDPQLAARLHPNDRLRIVRGLEVHRQTGQRLSALQDAHAAAPDRLQAEAVWLDHPDTAAHDLRIAERVRAMLEHGYVDEVRGLLDRGLSRAHKPMQSLGYRHLCDHLLDGLDLDEAARRTVRDTRRFARKQRTWRRALGFRAATPGDVDRAATRAFDPRSADRDT